MLVSLPQPVGSLKCETDIVYIDDDWKTDREQNTVARVIHHEAQNSV